MSPQLVTIQFTGKDPEGRTITDSAEWLFMEMAEDDRLNYIQATIGQTRTCSKGIHAGTRFTIQRTDVLGETSLPASLHQLPSLNARPL